MWQCLETVLIVTMRGRSMASDGCRLDVKKSPQYQKITWPQISVMWRLRNPVLGMCSGPVAKTFLLYCHFQVITFIALALFSSIVSYPFKKYIIPSCKNGPGEKMYLTQTTRYCYHLPGSYYIPAWLCCLNVVVLKCMGRSDHLCFLGSKWIEDTGCQWSY